MKVADHSGNVLNDFALGILAEVATQGSDIRSERQLRAEERRVAAGKPPRGGPRHFGYHSGKPTCGCGTECEYHAVREDEAEVVREMARRWLDGEKLRQLVAELNQRGVPTVTGAAWRNTGLRKLLLSQRVAGIRVHRSEEVKGSWEPIISEGLHQRLRAKALAQEGRRAPVPYPLTGLIACDRCSTKEREVRLNGKKQGNVRRYFCAKCHKNSIAADPIEAALWNATLGRSWQRERLGEREIEEREVVAKRELREVEAALDELDDAYWQARSIAKRTYVRQASKLRARIDTLRDEVKRLRAERDRAAGTWTALVALADHYDNAGPTERRRVLEGAVRRIAITPSDKRNGPRADLSRLRVGWADGTVQRGDELVAANGGWDEAQDELDKLHEEHGA